MPPTAPHQSTGALDSAVRLNVALLVVLAALPLVNPRLLLRGFGIAGASFAVFGLVRVFAVFALVLAVLLWGAREWLRSAPARGTVRALTAAYAAGAVLLMLQQSAVWYGHSGLALIIGCVVLAFAYGHALTASRPVDAPAA